MNAWVVEGDGGVMLVDCGSAGDDSLIEAFTVALRAAGHGVEDVSLVVATHTHSDHAGIVAWLQKQSGAELWMHPATAHYYDAMRDPQGIEAARERRARAEGVPEDLLADYRDIREEVEGMLAPVDPDRELVDGMRLPSALGDWEVVETPGHAPSHVSLIQHERRVGILGDLISPAFAPYYDYGYTPDPVAEYLSSLDRIEGFDLRLGLPGHGRPIEDVAGVIAMHRQGVAERLHGVEAALRDGMTNAYEVCLELFGEPADGEVGVWQLGEVIAYLGHLRRSGRVRRSELAGGRFRYEPA